MVPRAAMATMAAVAAELSSACIHGYGNRTIYYHDLFGPSTESSVAGIWGTIVSTLSEDIWSTLSKDIMSILSEELRSTPSDKLGFTLSGEFGSKSTSLDEFGSTSECV